MSMKKDLTGEDIHLVTDDTPEEDRIPEHMIEDAPMSVDKPGQKVLHILDKAPESVKRICKNTLPTHREARRILKQLKTNPEVCEKCNIHPCTMAKYIFG